MEINFINALLYSIIPTLIGTLLTLYFTEKVKGKVKNGFDKKLEKIKNDHSIELSKFQAEINSLKSKENFKFTKLHEKRFDILEDTYILLNKALNELNIYIHPIKNQPKGMNFEEYEDKLHSNFANSHNKFVEFYSNSKIYLEINLISLIDSYLKETNSIYNDYNLNHFLRKLGDKPNLETLTKASTAYKKIPEKIIPIKKEIEENFRELLER